MYTLVITSYPSTTCINICFLRLSFFFYLFGGFSLFLLMAVFSLSSSSSWCVTHALLRITFLCFINQLYSLQIPSPEIFLFSTLLLYLYLYPCSHRAILIDFQKQKVEFRYLAIHAFEKSPPTPSEFSFYAAKLFFAFNSPSSHHLSLPASVLFIQFRLSN